MATTIQGPRVNVPVPQETTLPPAIDTPATKQSQTVQQSSSDELKKDKGSGKAADQDKSGQSVKASAQDMAAILTRASSLRLGTAAAQMAPAFAVDLQALLASAPGLPLDPGDIAGLLRLQGAVSSHPELQASALSNAVNDLADFAAKQLTEGAAATFNDALKNLPPQTQKALQTVVAAFKRQELTKEDKALISKLAQQLAGKAQTITAENASALQKLFGGQQIPSDVLALLQGLKGRAFRALTGTAKADEAKSDGAKGKETKNDPKADTKGSKQAEGLRQQSEASEVDLAGEIFSVPELEPVVRRSLPRNLDGLISGLLANGSIDGDMANIIMLGIISDDRQDLKAALEEMQAVNAKKRARRDFITKMKEQRAAAERELRDRYDAKVKAGEIDPSQTSFDDFAKGELLTVQSSDGSPLPFGNSSDLSADAAFSFLVEDDPAAAASSSSDAAGGVAGAADDGAVDGSAAQQAAADPGGLSDAQLQTYATRLGVKLDTLKAMRAFYFNIKPEQRQELGLDDSFEAWLIDAPPSGLGASVPPKKDQDLALSDALKAEQTRIAQHFAKQQQTLGENAQAAAMFQLPPAMLDGLRAAFDQLSAADRAKYKDSFLGWLQGSGMLPVAGAGAMISQRAAANIAVATKLIAGVSNEPADLADVYNLKKADLEALQKMHDSLGITQSFAAWLRSPAPGGPGLVRDGTDNDNKCVAFFLRNSDDPMVRDDDAQALIDDIGAKPDPKVGPLPSGKDHPTWTYRHEAAAMSKRIEEWGEKHGVDMATLDPLMRDYFGALLGGPGQPGALYSKLLDALKALPLAVREAAVSYVEMRFVEFGRDMKANDSGRSHQGATQTVCYDPFSTFVQDKNQNGKRDVGRTHYPAMSLAKLHAAQDAAALGYKTKNGVGMNGSTVKMSAIRSALFSDLAGAKDAADAAKARLDAYHEDGSGRGYDRMKRMAERRKANARRAAIEDAKNAAIAKARQKTADAAVKVAAEKAEKENGELNDAAAKASEFLVGSGVSAAAVLTDPGGLSEAQLARYADRLGVAPEVLHDLRALYFKLVPGDKAALAMPSTFEAWLIAPAPQGLGLAVPPAGSQQTQAAAALAQQQQQVAVYFGKKAAAMGECGAMAALFQVPMPLLVDLRAKWERLTESDRGQSFTQWLSTLGLVPNPMALPANQRAGATANNISRVQAKLQSLPAIAPPAENPALAAAAANALEYLSADPSATAGENQAEPAQDATDASNAESGGQRLTLAELDARIQGWQDGLDSLSEAGEEMQLRLQMLMDRLSKSTQMLTNMMKKFAETAQNIIANMK